MPVHIVKQGEHLSGLAQRFGFRDYRTIWNDPGNDALRKLRKDPHVLRPGDSLFIPEKQAKVAPVATGNVHRFVVKTMPLRVRLVLKDFDSQPLANVACTLEIEGTRYPLTSDANGVIEQDITKTARNGVLRVPSFGLEWPVQIGSLDPVDSDLGWRARLINLGYYPGGLADTDGERLRHAIEEFQCDHDLKVTGEADAATQSALVRVHGV
jgi:hypothetical protein